METKTKLNVRLHRAETRGYVDHGWLKARHSFSFASYYNAERIRFGLLRVLNDDIVAPGMGFGTHPHDNMEIVTIPLMGALEHKDSMGHIEVVSPGEVQNMSAGSGITHSEYNHSKDEPINLLQIWVFPKEENIKPRYDQRAFKPEDRLNRFEILVSPDKSDNDKGALWINQDAVFSMAEIEKGKTVEYKVKFPGNGVYLFVIEGSVSLSGETINRRDAAGIEGADTIEITAGDKSTLLAIEIPMNQ